MAQESGARTGGVTVELSHRDKMFFPDDGITQGDVIGYYQQSPVDMDRAMRWPLPVPVMANPGRGNAGHLPDQQRLPPRPAVRPGRRLASAIAGRPGLLSRRGRAQSARVLQGWRMTQLVSRPGPARPLRR